MPYTRTYSLNDAPGGDLVKEAIAGLDTDLTGAFAHVNSEEVARIAADGVRDAAIALKAPLSSPHFTDIPTAPTPAVGTNTTQIATMEAVQTAVLNVTAGDIAVVSGDSGKFLTNNGTTVSWAFPPAPYIYIRDEKTATAGGTFTSGAWRTRDLNVEVVDTHNLASLATNQITLAAGTYRIRALAPAYGAVQSHAARLQNITAGTTLISGNTVVNSVGTTTRSVVTGRITLAVQSVLELQHQTQATVATNGFGATNFVGVTDVYAEIELWKELT